MGDEPIDGGKLTHLFQFAPVQIVAWLTGCVYNGWINKYSQYILYLC